MSDKPTLFLIDRKASPIPYSLDVTPPEASEVKLAGGQRRYIEDLSGVDISLVFGSAAFTPTELRELELLRGRQGLHMLSFNNISCDDEVELLVYMPKIPHIRMSEMLSEHGIEDFAYSRTEIVCHQVNPAFQLVTFEWWFFENAGYTTGDSKYRVTMPAAGRFVGASGYWFDIIGGAGNEIHVQLRNATQGGDYFTTKGKFKVNSATKQMEDTVLTANPTWVKDDIVDLDVDQVTSGSPSAGAAVLVVQMAAEIYA